MRRQLAARPRNPEPPWIARAEAPAAAERRRGLSGISLVQHRPEQCNEPLRRLCAVLEQLRIADHRGRLRELPLQLAELCSMGIERGIEPDFCRSLLTQLAPMARVPRPFAPPGPLAIQVLGGFGLRRHGRTLDLGAKPATRSLDIVRILALAHNHTCALEKIYDWLWPDADGDKAKASCEQALHRLRKRLGEADLVIQREGKLRLAHGRVQVDLHDWELRAKQALAMEARDAAAEAALARAFFGFSGPLLLHEPSTAWSLPAAERVRGQLLDVAIALGKRSESRAAFAAAQAVYLRALDFYPASTRLYEALIRTRVSQGDRAGALEDYDRYERTRQVAFETSASAAIHGLIAPLLRTALRA